MFIKMYGKHNKEINASTRKICTYLFIPIKMFDDLTRAYTSMLVNLMSFLYCAIYAYVLRNVRIFLANILLWLPQGECEFLCYKVCTVFARSVVGSALPLATFFDALER